MIHIAITLDQNLFVPLFALLSSIINNKKDSTAITFHCIATGLNEQQTTTISNYLFQNNISISFYSIDEKLTQQFYIHNENHFTAAAYYRLFFPALISSEIEKLLYLDIDTLVLKDLSILYNTDLKNYCIGAVYDNYVKNQPLIGILEEGNYFNSGVLLINCKKWNEDDITHKCIDYLLAYPKNILYVDQCVLNAIFRANYLQLPIYYNMLYSYLPQKSTRKEMRALLNQIHVIHFTLHKPWKFLCKNPYRKLYKNYLRKTPLAESATITDFSKKKIIPYIRMIVLETYLYSGWLQKIYYRIKN